MSRVLLTGFGPFGEQRVNPSAIAVELVTGVLPAHIEIVTEVLPVSFARAVSRVAALIADHRPDIVLGVGLAAGRTRISLERAALNLDDARISDVDGAQPVDQPVIPGEPAALLTKLPVKAALAALQEMGLSAELSLSAGSYVCNAVMFASLASAGELPATRAGFVHVPPAEVLDPSDVARGLAAVIQRTTVTGADLAVPGGRED